MQTQRFPAGETIVRKGDVPESFYVITRGEVVVTGARQGGQEVELATLSSGDYFGEIGLVSHVPRTASVRARTAVELLALDREIFRKMMESSEGTAEDLAEVVRRRLWKGRAHA